MTSGGRLGCVPFGEFYSELYCSNKEVLLSAGGPIGGFSPRLHLAWTGEYIFAHDHKSIIGESTTGLFRVHKIYTFLYLRMRQSFNQGSEKTQKLDIKKKKILYTRSYSRKLSQNIGNVKNFIFYIFNIICKALPDNQIFIKNQSVC
jgi:hypothetical protein